jgi:hypothetical protein
MTVSDGRETTQQDRSSLRLSVRFCTLAGRSKWLQELNQRKTPRGG